MPTNAEDTLLPFNLPSIGQKKITAAFDGGQISSDGGVLLLAGADHRLRLIDRLAELTPDHRDPARITRTIADQRGGCCHRCCGSVMLRCHGYPVNKMG